MPIPSAAVMSAAKAAGPMSGFGSSFLTGLGSGVASGIGSMLGKGDSFASQKRSMRTQHEYNHKYFRLQNDYLNLLAKERERDHLWPREDSQIQRRLADAKAAGVHPLIAMGLSPSAPGGPAAAAGAPSAVPIPGQSPNFGSAVEQGINTYLDVNRRRESAANQRKIAKMQVDEQRLRNEWLQTQINHSKTKTAAIQSNAQQDVTKIPLEQALQGRHPPSIMIKEADRYPHTTITSGHGYNLFGGIPIKQRPGKLTVEGAEDSMGEFGALLYSPFSILQDIGYTLDQKLKDVGTKWYNAPQEDVISP